MIEIILTVLPEGSHIFLDAYVPKCHLYQGTGNLGPNWLHF